MRYSLFAGGKRLRPILCVSGASAVGGDERDVLPVACALELIHTYSLIHDDLPAMDDDDMRRGKPTCHKVFGEAVAVLAGDGLLTEAFYLMSRKDLSGHMSPHALLQVIPMIASAAGYQGMVGGQVVDIQSEGKGVEASLVEFIHTHKTGALITASVVSGALMGGGTQEQVAAIRTYGQKIGLAFQIADDILDIEGDTRTLGKGVGNDARKGKITYPSVLGLDKSKKIQRLMIKEAFKSLEAFDNRADPLRNIAIYIIERKK
jgi:geranylgeranyl diphosphate synthase type II